MADHHTETVVPSAAPVVVDAALVVDGAHVGDGVLTGGAALPVRPASSARTWARAWAVSGGLLLTALIMSRAASAFIGSRFPDRPKPPDLLFDSLPLVPWTQYITDITLLVQLALLVWYLSRGRWHRLPEMIAMFSIMEILRAVFITFTPLAGPLGNGAHYGIIHATQNGEFPSGPRGLGVHLLPLRRLLGGTGLEQGDAWLRGRSSVRRSCCPAVTTPWTSSAACS